VAIACASLLAGYYFARRAPQQPPLAPAAALAPGGEQAAAPAPARVPEVRPLFTLKDAEGRPRSIAEWDGKALMINFWATWCPPCRREIPLLNALRADYGSRGFEVVGVAVDFREDVLAYMKEMPIDYPVLIGEQDGLDAARAFGMETIGFPFTVFTDSRGRIVTVHVGELHPPEASVILAAIAEVDAGRLELAAAREAIRTATSARPAGTN
jgi:thiol-disulfide isomerase/thioredoxin